MADDKKSNIKETKVINHRYCKKLYDNDYGTVAFLINKQDILQDKKKNADSFVETELKYNCLYFLIGYEQDNTVEKMYVGQAGIRNNGESVLDRLNEHKFRGNDPEKYMEKWEDIVVVTNEKGAWGSTELDALEYIFWSLIPVGNRYNSQTPNPKGADLKAFTNSVNQIKDYLNYLNYTMFQSKSTKDIKTAVEKIDNKKSNLPVDLDKGTTKIPNITTPEWLVNKMVDSLPSELFDSTETKFLDPACKGGEFLVALLKRFLSSENHKSHFKSYPMPEIAQAMYVVNKQLFGIALSKKSLEVALKNLNLSDTQNTIRCIPDYINSMKNKEVDFNSMIEEEFNKNMHFDVAIGNPPYQESNGGGNGGSGSALYHYFIEKCADIADRTCLIVPARWMSDRPNGISADDLRNLRSRTDIVSIKDFGEEQVFKGINIAGGVCIINLKKGFQGKRLDTHGVIIRNPIYKGILEKVLNIQFKSLANYIESDCYRSGKHMNSGWKDFGIAKNESDTIKYYCSDKDSLIGYGYVSPDQIIKNYDTVNEYKVAIKSSSPTDGMVIYPGFVMEPGSCCSRTYIVLHDSELINSVEKAENAIKYLETKFARACIKAIKTTQNASRAAYTFVPLQDFHSSSDIDWKKSLAEIDQQLYKKYQLSESEIEFIEKEIKPMKEISDAVVSAVLVQELTQQSS